MNPKTLIETQGPDLADTFSGALCKAQQLRNRKGNRSWRQFIAEQGVNVYGRPMPDHQPRAFMDLGPNPAIVVDNSLPESTQEIAIVQQYLHLELEHSPEALDQIQRISTLAGALTATLPTGIPGLTTYFEENPWVDEPLRAMALISGILILCAYNSLETQREKSQIGRVKP
jgi:hypothetical protein